MTDIGLLREVPDRAELSIHQALTEAQYSRMHELLDLEPARHKPWADFYTWRTSVDVIDPVERYLLEQGILREWNVIYSNLKK